MVYGLITGYGESGPDADRAAYDVRRSGRAPVCRSAHPAGRTRVPARRHGWITRRA
nr:hypothetical protein [Mycobacterium kansasii]